MTGFSGSSGPPRPSKSKSASSCAKSSRMASSPGPRRLIDRLMFRRLLPRSVPRSRGTANGSHEVWSGASAVTSQLAKNSVLARDRERLVDLELSPRQEPIRERHDHGVFVAVIQAD